VVIPSQVSLIYLFTQYLDCSPVYGGTEPIEVIQISQPSVYAELDKNRQDETANDGAYQKLLKRHLTGYEIPARTEVDSSYEEVYHIKKNLAS
jgi:hypothetical protein